MSTLLQVEGVSCDFPQRGGRRLRVLDGVSLELARSEVLGLVGESGSGKSTLGRCIAGLLPCAAGSIRFDGEELPRSGRAALHARAGRIQMVFQDPYGALNPRLGIGQTLAEPLHLARGARPGDAALIAGWLERVGLRADHLQRFPHELSGGQRQRVGIARALIGGPQLLVCDEPTAALDVSVQAQIVNLLETLRRETGVALLFISHDLGIVRHLADRVAVMQGGRIVEQGPVEAVCGNPRDPCTQRLLAARLEVPVPAPGAVPVC